MSEWHIPPDLPPFGKPCILLLHGEGFYAELHPSLRMPDQLIWHVNATDYVAVDHPLIDGWKLEEECEFDERTRDAVQDGSAEQGSTG